MNIYINIYHTLKEGGLKQIGNNFRRAKGQEGGGGMTTNSTALLTTATTIAYYERVQVQSSPKGG
jgi:hypothetical protein